MRQLQLKMVLILALRSNPDRVKHYFPLLNVYYRALQRTNKQTNNSKVNATIRILKLTSALRISTLSVRELSVCAQYTKGLRTCTQSEPDAISLLQLISKSSEL